MNYKYLILIVLLVVVVPGGLIGAFYIIKKKKLSSKVNPTDNVSATDSSIIDSIIPDSDGSYDYNSNDTSNIV